MLKDQLQSDLKASMLSGDKTRTSVLNMMKSSILNAEIASGVRQTGLDDFTVMSLLQKEAKKRLESADLYKKAGDSTREAAERAEYDIIAAYLPTQMTDDELASVVNDQIDKLQPQGIKDMGRVIGAIKTEVGEKADGSRIANLVKEKLS